MRTRDLVVGVAGLVLSLPLDAAPGRWERLGPDTGVVLSLAAAPSRPRTVYAALQYGGVFRSEDGGRTWAPANQGLGWMNPAYDPVVTPWDPEMVYVLANSRLYKTTDGGRSWKKLEAMAKDGPVRKFLVHPKDPRILYAGNPFKVPMRRSRDGGSTWEEIPGAPQAVSALLIDPSDPNVLYAGRGHGRDSGVLKSTDGGDTWKEINQGLNPTLEVDELLLDPRSPRTLWLSQRTGPPERRLWKSTDAGESWAPVEHGLGKAALSLLTAADEGGRTVLYASVNYKLHRSEDGGVSWWDIDPRAPEFRGIEIAVLPLPDGDLLAGARGGVFRSRNRGASWMLWNPGLSGNAITGLAIDPRNRSIYATVEGIAPFKSEDRGASWRRLSLPGGGGAGSSIVIHPTKPDTVYVGGFQKLGRSYDGAKSWDVSEENCLNAEKMVADPALPTGLYSTSELSSCMTNCVVRKSVDDGKTWTCVFNIPRKRIRFLAADPVRPLTVYVDKDGDLYRSEDAGFSWHLLASGLQATTLAFAPTPSGPIYAGLYQRGGVLRSVDGGKTWLPSGPGLPQDDPVTGIALDPKAPSTLYAATSLEGIFKSIDAGATWISLAPAPENVRVESLVLDPRDRSALYVGTYGGGVMRWRLR
jgi:photosystem II stability/assembly factor-like uncharacterized protein